MTRKENYVPIVLVLLTAVTRYLTRSRVLYDIDSVNFAMGLDHWDPAVHQPHPPGYFLYVLLGRLVRMAVGDANDALVLVSLVSGCAAVWLVYRLAEDWYGARAAACAGVLFVVSPLVWFHGTVALTYGVEMMFSAAAGYLCWRGGAAGLVGAAAVIALSAGFRQSSALFLLPLLVYSLRRVGWATRVWAACVFVLTTLCWVMPMVWAAGGMGAYVDALWALWTLVPGNVSQGIAGPAMVVGRVLTVSFVLVTIFGLAAVRGIAKWGGGERRFVLVWVGPALVFFCLVFFKYANSGYLLIVSPPLFAWLGYRMAGARVGWILAVVFVNSAMYLFGPWYFSWREVRQFERELAATAAAIRAQVKPGKTLLVGFDSHFLGYRHAGYYLPEFGVIQYPEIAYGNGVKVFGVRAGRTALLGRVDVAGVEEVVLAPLPDEAQYLAFLRPILQRIGSMKRGGDRCVGGDVCRFAPEALRELFPRSQVYTGVDTWRGSDNLRSQLRGK
ncbi:MAG: DUF2723 domain-containing protein [Acidobacteria bacterium]|nr:DUF2723 domain-containing protein [Acidobacteriota bacterium]